jgi:hypothetical protein
MWTCSHHSEAIVSGHLDEKSAIRITAETFVRTILRCYFAVHMIASCNANVTLCLFSWGLFSYVGSVHGYLPH